MTYPKTGSTLTANGTNSGANITSTGVSTNILITVGPVTVGAVQTLSISEQRPIKMIDEVGTDGHIDSCPTGSTNITGSIDRIRFDRMRLLEALGRGYVHVAAQRIAFDLVIIDTWYGDGDKQLITTIKNVWIKGIDYSAGASDWILQDKANWEAETIFSTLGTSGQAATGGSRGIPLQIDPYEQAADRGDRRGSMDAPGLIQAFYST